MAEKEKEYKDGWHKICGYNVYIENDKVLRGTKSNGTLPAYVYRRVNERTWSHEENITVNAFRAGIRRGTIRMF